MGLDLSGNIRYDEDTDALTESLSEKENARRSGNGYSESKSTEPSKRRPRKRIVGHISDSPDKWSYGNRKLTRKRPIL